ncbi:hypothetical protein [Moorena sp. SIO1G6]|nr:hypothetical protein [Moorena sp. SIO1G6]
MENEPEQINTTDSWERIISNALANTDSSYHTYEVHKIFSLLQ